jgi:hypothetical protein
MFGKKAFSIFAAFILLIVAAMGALAASGAALDKGAEKARVEAPLNLAILVQDDLVSRVGNELEATRDFIRSLPAGSRVMIAYVTVEALRKFDEGGANRNALLLISDGLDTSHGFDIDSAANTIDLHRAVKEAQKMNVAVYSFYAPTVGLTSWNHTAIGYGQSSLNRLSNETGGRAFFQGTSFVTFDSYFERLRETLNNQYAKAY